MFMWDCIKSEGVHLGTCSDRFLFGSCCHHNSTLSLALVDGANQRLNSSSAISSHASISTNQSLSSSSLNLGDDSHSIVPQTSTLSTTAPITAPPPKSSPLSTPQTTTSDTISTSTFLKPPDRLFLSSHTSDYVTTTSATSNSSNSDHIVSLAYDDAPNLQSNNASSKDQQHSSNKIYTPSSSNEWTNANSSNEPPTGTSLQPETTTVSSTTTNTVTTSVPANPNNQQQLSEQPHQWHHLNYNTTQGPSSSVSSTLPLSTQTSTTNGGGGPAYLKPIASQQPSDQTNQILAYQLVSRPSTQVSTMTSSRPITTQSPSSLSDLNQTQRPQQSAGSWLRPSLLANAIFHSFKPYLNPNRQRPTYRPYIGGGFRPQNQQQKLPPGQQQQQRPSLFPSVLNSANQQQAAQVPADLPNVNHINESKLSNPFATSANSTMLSSSSQQITHQENSDHHIVNPITMTDRRRPIDKNNQYQSNFMGSMQSGMANSQIVSNNTSMISIEDQKQYNFAHYEMLNNQGQAMASENINNSIKFTNGPNVQPANSAANVSSSLASISDHLMDSNTNASLTQADLVTSWPAPPTTTTTTTITNPTTSITLPSSPTYDYNGGAGIGGSHHHAYGGANHSLSHYQQIQAQQQQQQQQLANQAPHSSMSNESVSSPSYPLISSGFLVTPPISDGAIDEIHGLSDGGHHHQAYEAPNKQQEPFSHLANGSLLSQLNSNFLAPNRNSVNSLPSVVDLPSTANTIMIGNIDEPPLSPSLQSQLTGQMASESSGMSAGQPTTTTIATVANSTIPSVSPMTNIINQFAGTVPPDANAACTTTPPPPSPSPPPTTTTATTTTTTTAATPNLRPHNHIAASSMASAGKEATCGVTALYPQTKVVGGKNAAFGAWPWQVSVRKVSFFGFSSTHRCGGAVISSEWIATAGHCVEDLALQSIRIRVGEYDFSTMAEPYPHIERGARKKVVHPKYNFYTYENDLALVQLDQPLQFSPHVAPICLPPDNIDLVGRNATVTGWGRLNEGGTLPTILQEVIVPIVSNDKCRDMFLRAGRPEYIPDIFLCAGYEEGGRDSCQGDSGGPLQVRGDDGRWVLAGIISWGIGCAEPLLVGVCSAIQRFKPWIQSTISTIS
jgi:hypothetical protein